MKVTIPISTSRSLPEGTRVLETDMKDTGWVSWVTRTRRGVLRISTCQIKNFACQNDTQQIILRDPEVRKLYKLLPTLTIPMSLKKRKRRHH